MASSSNASNTPMDVSDQKSSVGKRKATEDPEEDKKESPASSFSFGTSAAASSAVPSNTQVSKDKPRITRLPDRLIDRRTAKYSVGSIDTYVTPETDIISVHREKVNQGFLVDNTVFLFQNITAIDLSITLHKAVFIIRSGLNKSNTVELLHRPKSKFFLFHERISDAFMQYQKDNRRCNMTLKNYCNPKEKNISMSDVISVTWGKSPIMQGSAFAPVGYLYKLYVHRKSTDELQIIHEGTYLDIITEFNRLIAECCLINMNSIKD